MSELVPRREVQGLYVHVPFCASDCAYCAFSREVPKSRDAIAGYLEALSREVDFWLAGFGGALTPATIYVGGGTPTYLTPSEWAELSRSVDRLVSRERVSEVTVEANPETLTAERLAALRAFGATRISIGAQSTRADMLAFLDRRHDWARVVSAVTEVRRAPGLFVSLDLIYGIPGSTLETWSETLRVTLALDPDHLSAYCLSYEEGTSLAKRKAKGDLTGLPDTVQRAQYDRLVEATARAGLERYEVSNFGRKAAWSEHNRLYWTRRPTLGIGPSAHSFLSTGRSWNHSRRTTWEAALAAGAAPIAGHERLGPGEVTAEVLMQLRIASGIPKAWVPERAETFWRRAETLAGEGLLEVDGRGLRLAREGWFVSDGIIADLLAALEHDSVAIPAVPA
jgi:oxygen-independent coproporphyrinogen-3 oxidase